MVSQSKNGREAIVVFEASLAWRRAGKAW